MLRAIEFIYSAAHDASTWPRALECIAKTLNSTAVLLIARNLAAEGQATLLGQVGMEGVRLDSISRCLSASHSWLQNHVAWSGAIATDQFPSETGEKFALFTDTPFYRECMVPLGFRHVLGSAQRAENDRLIQVIQFRTATQGVFGRRELRVHDRLMPHLRQALEVNQRLEMLEAKLTATTGCMDRLPCGVIFLDKYGRLILVNAMAGRLLAEGLCITVKNGRLTAVSTEADKRLQRQIHSVLSRHKTGALKNIGALEVADASGTHALSLVMLPLTHKGGNVAAEHPELMMVVISTENKSPVNLGYLRNRYGYTLQEAKIAQRLSTGIDLKTAAHDLGIGYETARWHLKGIFQKTGIGRQADLVRLLVSDFAAALCAERA